MLEAFKLGPLLIFFEVMAFTLVVGALAMIIDALRRDRSRWTVPWTRWIWVTIGAIFILSLVGLLIWNSEPFKSMIFIGTFVVLVTEVAYLLRVVFPAPSRLVVPASQAKDDALDDGTRIAESSNELD